MTADYKENKHRVEEWDQMIGYPISYMVLGYLDENEDFIVCYEIYE